MSKSVLIVDKEPVCRLGLAGLLRSNVNLQVAGEVGSVSDALKCLGGSDVHLILLSAGVCGRQVIRDYKELRAHSRAAVVILVSQVAEQTRRVVLRLGVAAYLSKRLPADRLLAEISATVGDTKRPAEASDKRRTIPRRRIDLLAPLTSREREVFTLVRRGYSNKTIGEELGVSVETVKVHVRHVLKKLGVNSRFDAAQLRSATRAL